MAQEYIEEEANGGTTTYEYYSTGSTQSIVYPNGSREDYTYYSDSTLHTLVNKRADQTIIDNYSYTYDDANNQISKTDAKGTTAYTYDSLNRLKSVTQPSSKATSYTYDKAGNRLTETVTYGTEAIVTSYKYNEQNRLEWTLTQSDGISEKTQYQYDSNGNMISSVVSRVVSEDIQEPEELELFKQGTKANSNVTIYEYDLWNRLTWSLSSGKIMEYEYNGEGRRTEKTVDGETTRYLYDYDKVVLEVDGNNAQEARNVYGINLIARSAESTTLYYMYNGHADVVALLDISCIIQAQYYYDAFGNILEESGTADNPIRYAGYQYDEETGLYYLNARYYDSKIARFISEDTYRGDASDPLSLNLYTYCANNPIRYWDPSGHAFTEWDSQNVTNYVDIMAIHQATAAWEAANKKGDKAGMATAHARAETARNKYRTNGEVGTGDGNTVTVKKSTNSVSNNVNKDVVIEAYDLLDAYIAKAAVLSDLLEPDNALNIPSNPSKMLYGGALRNTAINRYASELDIIQSLLIQNTAIQSNMRVFNGVFTSYLHSHLFSEAIAKNYQSLLCQNKEYNSIITAEKLRRGLEVGAELLSFALDSIDVVDIFKGTIETALGKDPITGNEVNRWVSGVSTGVEVALPFIFGAIAKRTAKPAVNVIDSLEDYASGTSKRTANTWEDVLLLNEGAAGVGNKAIVIGEGMPDVKTVAKELQSEGVNAKWYQAWSKNFPENRPMTPDELKTALSRNQRWIDSKIKQGYDVYDLGIDPLKTTRSPFYQLEQSRINNYCYPTIDITGRRP